MSSNLSVTNNTFKRKVVFSNVNTSEKRSASLSIENTTFEDDFITTVSNVKRTPNVDFSDDSWKNDPWFDTIKGLSELKLQILEFQNYMDKHIYASYLKDIEVASEFRKIRKDKVEAMKNIIAKRFQ